MSEARLSLLAERHRRVLRLYGQRYRAKEIARALSLSENTVNTYLTEAVQILEVGGRTKAAEVLAKHEDPSQLPRYQIPVADEERSDASWPEPQLTEEGESETPSLLPLRSTSGAPNRLPVYLRLLWMLAILLVLVAGIAIAVAVYTVDVKPMEHLLH